MLPRENHISIGQQGGQSDNDPGEQTVTQSTVEPDDDQVSQPTLRPDEADAGVEENHEPDEWMIVRYDIGDPNPIGK
ncbi:MAG TPA: hypothetical protein VJ179_01770 [Patescibacteria group bacterium]|nr:hypothetical protein [Patescibacteria group bacterium]